MIKVNIDKDENLQDAVNVFISALLPHENYDSAYFSEILNGIFDYIKLEEFSGPYYVLLNILDQLKSLKSRFDVYEPSLTEEILSNMLEVSIADAIMDSHVRMRDILARDGLQTSLEIETVKEMACRKLYSMTMELYAICFDLAQESSTALNNIPMLRSAFIAHVSTESIQTQVEILQNQHLVDKNNYSGADDWVEYLKRFNIELSNRIDEDKTITKPVENLDEGLELLQSVAISYEPIAEYGIPEIDYINNDPKYIGTPILKHRLVVVVGQVNIGKSMFCIWQTARILAQGKKVIYMFGESSKGQIYAKILIAYIWIKFGKNLLIGHLTGTLECTDEIQKIINMSIVETMPLLLLKNEYSYDTLYDELVADYDKFNFDALFIDHSFALDGLSVRDNGKSSIDKLAVALRNFKRKYPVFVLVASHPSTDARSAMAKDKKIRDSSTKGSSNLEAEADDLFIIRDNEALQKQSALSLINKKRRDADQITKPIILRKRFNCYCFEYDESLQYKDVEESDAEDALAELDQIYGNDDDIYNLDAF